MPLLSLIVPVFNEEQDLTRVVERLMKVQFPFEVEWLFVDDHSSDASLQILNDLASRHRLRVFAQDANRGKGAALVRGIHEAKGEIIAFQDADFEYDPAELPKLVQPIIEDRADVVYGSRFRLGTGQVHRTYHYFINRWLTFISNLLSGIYLTDMETCYKIFRADLLRAMTLRSPRFGIEVELTAYVAKTRARIQELPISYFPRTHLEGKKIGWKDGLAALFHLVRYNLLTSPNQAFHELPDRYHPRDRVIIRKP